MYIINEFEQKNKIYLPHNLNTKYYIVLFYRNGNKATYVCRKYHISKDSLSEWNKKFDGTKEALIDKSHRHLTPHPNAHITVCERWYKLKVNKGYTRYPASLYRFLRRIGCYNELNINHTSK